jgi:hypothetical protein
MKKFRMPISKTFPATHPKAGQPTWFRIGIRTGDKQHTIRCNYSYWNNIAQKVNTGEAIIVYYEWDAKPYNSKTTDLFTSTKMYLSKLEFADPGGVTSYNNVLVKCFIDDKPFAIPFNIIAENDYFENPHDFYDWFAGDFTKTFALNCFNKPAHEIYKEYKV